MEQINDNVEEIAQTVFDNIPDENWVKAIVTISMLSTYNEVLQYILWKTQVRVFHLTPTIPMPKAIS